MLVLASVGAMLLATSSAPTPLYALYSAKLGLTPAAISLVFGVYALSLLVALLTLGRMSDYVGRKPVLLVAIVVQIVAMIVLATAGALWSLLAGRLLQGLSTGAGIAAVGAGLVDIDAGKGTTANSVAPPAGSAIGALGAAIMVEFLPAPTHVVYVVFAVLLVVQGWLVLGLTETSARAPGWWANMRPRVRVPMSGHRWVWAAAPVLFAVWALSGLFGSLGPSLVRQVTGSAAAIYGALPLAIVGAMAPPTAYATRGWSPRRSLVVSIAALVGGVAVTIAAVLTTNAAALLAGAMVAGAAFGAGFRGGMQLVISAVEPAERAATVSVLYIVSYLGFGVPAILAGVAVAHTGSLTGTVLGYGGVLIALAMLAAVTLHRSPAVDVWTSTSTHDPEQSRKGEAHGIG
jgi:MFS family permease